ncbi:MAG TPA: metallophosphoesterase, partial [Chthonomonadales bacterium]|nr:metallophosphoesterase [Chthonomonadales bacterium]
GPRSGKLRRHVRLAGRIAHALAFAALCIAGATLAVFGLGRSEYQWHGLGVEVRLAPSLRGETRIELTPLGQVSAHTHTAPIALVVSLVEIRLDQIQALVRSMPKRHDIARDFRRSAKADLTNFIWRQIALAVLGALLSPLVLRCRRARLYLCASLVGGGAVGLLLAAAITTFSGRAFEAPVYSGALKQAPWVVRFGKDAFTKIEALSQKLKTVAENLNVLYGRISSPAGALLSEDAKNTVHVLHVSDIHNNYAAIAFIKEVAADFHVAFIVDTGDLTDFGSPPETAIVREIGRIGYPYVSVLGNHDSRAVAAALSKLPNATLLNHKMVTIDGFRILGVPNPASARAGPGSVDTTPEEIEAGGRTLLSDLEAQPPAPDIVAVHDPQEGRAVWGIAPLVLCGHLHRAYVEVDSPTGAQPETGSETPDNPALANPAGTTVVCNAGTTGAAGLRYFEKERGVPFSCAVLTFRTGMASALTRAATGPLSRATRPSVTPAASAQAPPARPKLLSIDIISLDGSLGEYSIDHHVISR